MEEQPTGGNALSAAFGSSIWRSRAPRRADSARTFRARSSTPAPKPTCCPLVGRPNFARHLLPDVLALGTVSDRTKDASDSERLLNVKTEQYVSVPRGVDKTHLVIALGYLATQKGYKTRFFSAADLVLMLEAAQRQGRYREVTNRAANAYRLLIIG